MPVTTYVMASVAMSALMRNLATSTPLAVPASSPRPSPARIASGTPTLATSWVDTAPASP